MSRFIHWLPQGIVAGQLSQWKSLWKSIEKALTSENPHGKLVSVISAGNACGALSRRWELPLRKFPSSLYTKNKAGGRMSDKPFLTYESLVVKLRDEKKLTIPEGTEAHVIQLLKKCGYFFLVSGYKNLFKASDGTYLPGVTIDDLFALYQFDNTLRNIFFNSIQIIEKEIKSLLSYSFTKAYGDDQQQYLSALHFDTHPGCSDEAARQAAVRKLISVLVSVALPPSGHEYIDHQWKNHQNVPLWVTVKALTLGNISKMYSLCHPSVQSGVAREFPGVSSKTLVGMLDVLTLLRNVCAHNERVYNFSIPKSRTIENMPVHGKLGIVQNASGAYRQGKNDLFAVVVCFKYLLDGEDFRLALGQLDQALSDLFAATKMIPPTKILSEMGFPANWKNIDTAEK
ncbi:MAG: Abi family protein [Oscillospiraceae bacterium]|nr:Abi family protein [Oscillospiraceae bacterium]